MSQSKSRGKEPEKTAGYLLPSYWDERFQKEDQYDWFKDYSIFKHILQPHLKPADKILVLGCGNSTMTADLWRDGYKNIMSIDLSEVVVEKMKAKAQADGMHSLSWQVADMLELPFGDQQFDAVLEKGTMDVLFVDNDSPWNPRAEVCTRVHKMLEDTHRVLRSQGVFVSISFAQPHFRQPFLMARQYTWSMQHFAFGETFHYYVYVLHKGLRDSQGDSVETAEGSYTKLEEGMTHEHMDEEDYLLRMDV